MVKDRRGAQEKTFVSQLDAGRQAIEKDQDNANILIKFRRVRSMEDLNRNTERLSCPYFQMFV